MHFRCIVMYSYISRENVFSFCQLRPKTSKFKSKKNCGIPLGFILMARHTWQYITLHYVHTCLQRGSQVNHARCVWVAWVADAVFVVVLWVFLRSCSASSKVCFRNPQSLETQTRLIDADMLIWTFGRPTMMFVVARVQRIWSRIHVEFAISRHLRCLCDLDPMDFHKFFLHELLRETVDRWAWCIEDYGSGFSRFRMEADTLSKWKECMHLQWLLMGRKLEDFPRVVFPISYIAVNLKNCFQHYIARMNSILNSHNL